MKKLILFILFIAGIGFALLNFKGLASQGTYNSIVLDFREDVPAENIGKDIEAIASEFGLNLRLNSIFSPQDHVYVVEGDQNLLKSLRNSPIGDRTEYIEPNYIYQTFETPNDPDYSKQWNFRSINVEQAWDETHGEGITVAVIDTGVSRVPDLRATEFVKGYDFIGDRFEVSDEIGHGTHVAGTIAQSTNNGYGVAGIAYKAKIMPLKVIGTQGGTVTDIAEAIKYAADHDADVINLSLGGAGDSSVLREAINYAYSKGVTIVAAAGNANQNAAAYPARYPKVISVAATDASGEKAPYSNFGAGVDLVAPGGSEAGLILQNTVNPETGKSEFVGLQGTSMAAPHVAGVAALIKAAGVTEPDEVFGVLKQSVRKVKEDPLNHYGAGHLDAAAAVKLALKGQITVKDFFRWLRDNGYLNPRFWLDGGTITLLPKLAMVLGSYLLAWFLRNYFPFAWSWPLSGGLVMGSTGLFFLQGFYVFDLPQWPFRVAGSSIPELGSTIYGSTALNPIFASVLIPLGLTVLLLGHRRWKWFAIGSSLGVAACLAVNAVYSPELMWLGEGIAARSFLLLNALFCLGLARLASKEETALS